MKNAAVDLDVLLVEDSLMLGQMAISHLRGMTAADVQVHWAKSLAEARSMVHTVKTDVILLDLGLPDSKGLDTVRDMRVSAPDKPIIVVSATDDRDTIIQALRLGASDYVAKAGLRPGAIVQKMEEVVERQHRICIENMKFEEELRELVHGIRDFATTHPERSGDVIRAVHKVLMRITNTRDEIIF